jgi:hypothetical protein
MIHGIFVNILKGPDLIVLPTGGSLSLGKVSGVGAMKDDHGLKKIRSAFALF